MMPLQHQLNTLQSAQAPASRPDFDTWMRQIAEGYGAPDKAKEIYEISPVMKSLYNRGISAEEIVTKNKLLQTLHGKANVGQTYGDGQSTEPMKDWEKYYDRVDWSNEGGSGSDYNLKPQYQRAMDLADPGLFHHGGLKDPSALRWDPEFGLVSSRKNVKQGGWDKAFEMAPGIIMSLASAGLGSLGMPALALSGVRAAHSLGSGNFNPASLISTGLNMAGVPSWMTRLGSLAYQFSQRPKAPNRPASPRPAFPTVRSAINYTRPRTGR